MDFHCGCDLYLSFANKLLEQGKFVKIFSIPFDLFLLLFFFFSPSLEDNCTYTF